MIRIYNSLAGQKEELKPVVPGQVGMYVCGPTVYDLAHIGNARPVVVFDVLYRLLQRHYPKVVYVRNITDVDDKINEAAKKNGEPISALTTRVTAGFHQDMSELGNLPPTHEPRATAHIPEMIGTIERLLQNQHAYLSEGHVLFSVKTDPQYGILSRRKLEDLIAGARVEVEAYKKDPGDFVLWKPADADDAPSSVFDSPWGRGRPGWHIECSAMSAKYLNNDFDIHGGGVDLKFPHHENEIAQSTCAHKGSHYAKYWMHNGFVTVNGEKMAKSAGNFVTVRDLLGKWPGEAIRFLLLKTHYRAPLDFTEEGLQEAKAELDSWYRVIPDLPDRSEPRPNTKIEDDIDSPSDILLREFDARLEDDLNTAGAISILRELRNSAAKEDTEAMSALREGGKKLGLLNMPRAAFLQGRNTVIIPETGYLAIEGHTPTIVKGYSPEKIEQLIVDRTNARKRKDFKESDRIRDELAAAGVILEDSPHGTTWRRK